MKRVKQWVHELQQFEKKIGTRDESETKRRRQRKREGGGSNKKSTMKKKHINLIYV